MHSRGSCDLGQGSFFLFILGPLFQTCKGQLGGCGNHLTRSLDKGGPFLSTQPDSSLIHPSASTRPSSAGKYTEMANKGSFTLRHGQASRMDREVNK